MTDHAPPHGIPRPDITEPIDRTHTDSIEATGEIRALFNDARRRLGTFNIPKFPLTTRAAGPKINT